MITGYYGKDGSMTKGWDNEAEAIAEMNEWYSSDEFKGCYVTEIRDGEWVIAY